MIGERTMSVHGRSSGFALPVAVFALVVVGVLASSGFYLARQEARITVASDHAARALYLAERGIQEVRLDWVQRKYNGMDLWTDTTITGTAENGDWEVVVTRTDTTNFLVESTGTVTVGGARLSGASRRVGLLVRVKFPELTPRAALTSVGPLEAEGQSDITGTDEHPYGWAGYCAGSEDQTGALVDDVDNIDQAGQAAFEGSPAIDEDDAMTSADLLDFGEMNYDDLTAMADKIYTSSVEITNTEPAVDGNGECDTGVQSNWGDPEDSSGPCFDYFPTIHVQGDLQLRSSASGQGLLLVDGDLTLQGGYEFHGIVIARGRLLTEGQGGHIHGGLILANENYEQSRSAGSSIIQYSSCAAARAIRNSSTSKPRPLIYRSWVDLSGISY